MSHNCGATLYHPGTECMPSSTGTLLDASGKITVRRNPIYSIVEWYYRRIYLRMGCSCFTCTQTRWHWKTVCQLPSVNAVTEQDPFPMPRIQGQTGTQNRPGQFPTSAIPALPNFHSTGPTLAK